MRAAERKAAPPKPSLTLPRGASRKGTASRLLVLLIELTEDTDIARPRLTPPMLEAPSLASPLPLRLPEAMLLDEEVTVAAVARWSPRPAEIAVDGKTGENWCWHQKHRGSEQQSDGA